ncbi:MAG TPA: tRNA uridine-5-carboxymethylaminomethyl(34) synthesis GTPase MnmE [Algoriphagus sp.]|jgi:tRNA modification GTPase|uniref:tRNA uridine-5-carboxymethylaminomethyl(34) synthesis GTPase MnmE n=2 Tax=Algoriphagus TaxID=246875 RepID=UPI000C376908|nr:MULTISPECIES: tRNA uridine-5-carboxymethylaminomethyl(34) synthesis GTPase MnmE [unclassified Algoriphagus]MAL11962.1 tRNA uridine-5-carboxymethylaminomethyl(34) synthesis GTPase MnmE [Algoriphagus sp.]MAN87412.1 tRNA uridine-5-carboxymethylaminomethyl(34) synthesis GTPase MnmE [Algoriphagus sp.]QYH38620.1 tRNA uridine-5-carboxymethylaminomethyl(34) synthesis GTPase MnmE [Algoriphagus sp. NBT04N3]HAD53453.1 tRNA uridine-5-carboxymethylaminomethyl(34) synthesis GTPase MnmE [Algoriphagus sp.]|tara:strand:- start:3145 stop:4527 length:1383 start_codon:yes stop_codon:yes gene_type:complete
MSFSLSERNDTIIALATSQGVGAIAVIRLSGPDSIRLVNEVFQGKNLEKQESHTIHFGTIRDGDKIIDEVLVSLFIAPKSFTKENVVEISTHGSSYIINQVIRLFMKKGVRPAKPGEFTQRAFLNGQFDLAQAEAVADLIHSDSEASHQAALNQMRGGFSSEIQELRSKLIHFASMIELELDFTEEDVEFASRDDLRDLVEKLLRVVEELILSFDLGNVIKNGVPTVIAGKPNAGKSTLLNALLNEEKAIVSDIAGTTRDFIEDEINIGGVIFRFIDTAGLRETTDTIEAIGVSRTQEKMKTASMILYLFDLGDTDLVEINRDVNKLENLGVPFVKVANKVDKANNQLISELKEKHPDSIFISAGQKENLEGLKAKILELVNLDKFKTGNTVVTNIRHYDSLTKTRESLLDVLRGLDQEVTNDFLAMDIRRSLHYLGEITGEITTDDLLANIFSKFCIGK